MNFQLHHLRKEKQETLLKTITSCKTMHIFNKLGKQDIPEEWSSGKEKPSGTILACRS